MRRVGFPYIISWKVRICVGFCCFLFSSLVAQPLLFSFDVTKVRTSPAPHKNKKRFLLKFFICLKYYKRLFLSYYSEKRLNNSIFFHLKIILSHFFVEKKLSKRGIFSSKKNFQSPKFMLSPLQQVIQKIKLPCSRWIRKSKKRKKCPPEEVIPALTSKGKEYNLDDRNVRLYIFSILIGAVAIEYHIREDKEAFYGDKDGTGNQLPHFNSGSPPKKLSNHHYWEKWSKLRNIRYPPKVTPFL